MPHYEHEGHPSQRTVEGQVNVLGEPGDGSRQEPSSVHAQGGANPDAESRNEHTSKRVPIRGEPFAGWIAVGMQS